MEEDEIDHLRRQVAYVLDGFCEGRITIPMAVPSFICMLPIVPNLEDNKFQSFVTVVLQGLAEGGESRQSAENTLVAYIVDERDKRGQIASVIEAVEILQSSGFEVSVDAVTNRFYVGEDGPYIMGELSDQARRRCGVAARWRRRTAIALDRSRSALSKRGQAARSRKDV